VVSQFEQEEMQHQKTTVYSLENSNDLNIYFNHLKAKKIDRRGKVGGEVLKDTTFGEEETFSFSSGFEGSQAVLTHFSRGTFERGQSVGLSVS
jgi:hypothetical protein